MSDQAIRPSFLNVPIFKKDKEAESKGASDDERALFAMSNGGGWNIFSTRANELLKELDEVNTQAIASGASLEEIGKNTIVISLTKDIVTRLLNMVTDAKEACESGEE